MPQKNADRPQSNLIAWTFHAPDFAYGAPVEWNKGHCFFTMRDHGAYANLTFLDTKAYVWNICTVPFSDRWRNRSLRFAQLHRTAEQFWAEVVLDISTMPPSVRWVPEYVQRSIEAVHKRFTPRIENKPIGIGTMRRGGAIR